MNGAEETAGASRSVRAVLEAFAGACHIAAAIVLRPLFLPRLRRWGATAAELQRALPGDDLVPESRAGYTQAITIHAPVEAVWPWLVQIGQSRGGFYSYEVLENLVGCDIHNAETILPEFQGLKTGDGIRLHPKVPALSVVLLEERRTLLLYSSGPIGQPPERAGPPEYFATTWLFHIEGLADGDTRLISRFRVGYMPRFGNDLAYRGLVEPISAVMQQRMLLGIKEQAETARQEPSSSSQEAR